MCGTARSLTLPMARVTYEYRGEPAATEDQDAV